MIRYMHVTYVYGQLHVWLWLAVGEGQQEGLPAMMAPGDSYEACLPPQEDLRDRSIS